MKGFCLSLLLDHFLSLSDLYLWAVATAFEKQGIVEMFGCRANGHLRTQKGFLTAWLSHHPSWDGSNPWNWETLPFVDCWCGAAWRSNGAQLCCHSDSIWAFLRTLLQTLKRIVSKNTKYLIPHPFLSSSKATFYCKWRHFLEFWWLAKLIFLCRDFWNDTVQ